MGQTVGMSAPSPRRPGRPIGGQLVIDRDHVLDAAERVIKRDGPGASLESVAVEAGVTKPIVYDRVGGRAELADALAERLSDRMLEATEDAIAGETLNQASLSRLVRANLLAVAKDRELFLYVTGGNTEQTAIGRLSLAERSTTPLAKTLAVWRKSQGFDAKVADSWSFAIVGMLQMISVWWISQPERAVDEVADQISDLMWNGLQGPRSSL